MKDNQEKISKTKVFTQVIHILPPPLPDFSSDFKSIREWLLSICMGNTPDQPIDTYSFGLFESPKEYILSFVGENTYNEGENRSITRIEFKPTTIYFKLPESKYKSLAREQVLSKLITELQEFVKQSSLKLHFSHNPILSNFAQMDRLYGRNVNARITEKGKAAYNIGYIALVYNEGVTRSAFAMRFILNMLDISE